jgi:hypothetical protein
LTIICQLIKNENLIDLNQYKQVDLLMRTHRFA